MRREDDETAIYEALSAIKTPNWDAQEAVFGALAARGEKKRPRRGARVGLLAAALAALLVLGAAAAGLSGLWQEFFYTEIPKNAVSTVGVSQTAGGYTLAVEDAIADDNGVILLLALSQADGEKIDPEAHLRTNSMHVRLLADGEGIMGGSGFEGSYLSGDGKTLHFCYECRFEGAAEFGEGLTGRTLTFTAEGVAVQQKMPDGFIYVRPERSVDLSPLAGLEIPDFSTLEHWTRDTSPMGAGIEQQDVHLSLPLEDEYPGYQVRGAVMTQDGLTVALTQQGHVRSGEMVCTAVSAEALVDARDGARYEVSRGTQAKLPEGGTVFLSTFRDCPLTAEDLPYLRLEVSYAVDRVLSEEPFSLTFTADSGAALILPLEQTVTALDTPLHLTELRLSALGVSVRMEEGTDKSDVLFQNGIAPVLTLRDGSTAAASWKGASGREKSGCSVGFQMKDDGGERIFLDTAQVASVSFCGETIWSAPE